MTIAIAVLVIPFIPDFPGSTKRWWLNREQQIYAVSRPNIFVTYLISNRTGVSKTKTPVSKTPIPSP